VQLVIHSSTSFYKMDSSHGWIWDFEAYVWVDQDEEHVQKALEWCI